MNKIEWNNRELQEYGFKFLFDKFKQYYLHEIFTDLKQTSIYEPCLGLCLFYFCSDISISVDAIMTYSVFQ